MSRPQVTGLGKQASSSPNNASLPLRYTISKTHQTVKHTSYTTKRQNLVSLLRTGNWGTSKLDRNRLKKMLPGPTNDDCSCNIKMVESEVEFDNMKA